ncbi:murein biosynthesis integral membrane protein MurJ [Kitasatospora acidiphila]|uniref:murein biosynthesis integral membrane protein MurJ n=1 Tax=Kitasatospora acidiphila TaxID=2567942 RepID=UPI003C774C85
MSERGGNDRLTEEPDWYLSETYAKDPFAADPYATATGPGPYQQPAEVAAEAAEEAEEATGEAAEGDPLAAVAPVREPALVPAGDGAEAVERAAPVREPATGPDRPADGPEPAAPVSRWARLAAAARARVAAAEAASDDLSADLSADLEEEPEAAAEPAEPDETDGTDALLGADALLDPVAAAVATESGEPFVPVIEFDPPLSPAETATAVHRPPQTPAPAAPAVPPKPPLPPAMPTAPDELPDELSDGLPEEPVEADHPASPGRVATLRASSAIMAAGTLASRATGFLRTMVIAAAIGVGTMGDSYSAANTLPTLLYILIGGGALNAVFVPQLVRSMKQDEDGGTAYANRLLTLVMAGLAGVVFVAVLAAPLLVQLISHSLMSSTAGADSTVALARYCLPTIFFMGVHVVMGQILNARGRFGAMMWTPVLNNVVVIFTFAMYLWVFGTFQNSRVAPESVSPEGLRLLGIGTLLGLAVQALAMVPYLRSAGFRFRPRFDWRGHGLGKAARLAKWTFFFVLANQAGYLVVTQLATAAGSRAADHGYLGVGLAAYSNALLIWQLPMAVITVSVMSAVLPRLSRAAADGDDGAVRDDLSHGLRTSAVAIVPAAFLFLALGPQIGGAIYGLGNGGSAAHGTTAVGYMLSAFALGLIPYSVQYVLLRGFYAYEDTRTPFSNTVWVAATQAGAALLCYLVLPAQWAVTGMALGYGTAYVVGVAVAAPKLKRRIGGLDTARITKTYVRLAIACLPAGAAGFLLALALGSVLSGWLGNVVAVLVAGAAQLALFVVLARRMRIEELNAMIGMVRNRLGR